MSATVSLRTQALGDLAVQSGDLRSRQWGPWIGYVECGVGFAPAEGEPVTAVVRREDGGEDTFVGTVRRAGNVPGSEDLFVSVVAGAGKLLEELPAVDHVAGATPVLAGLVARRLCDDAGEQLADGVEEALDAHTLPRWHRAAGTPGWTALDLLADELGFVWRVQRDGKVWIGEDTFPAASGSLTYITEDPDDGTVVYAPDGAPVVAGQAVGDVNAVEVAYTIHPGRLRVSVRGAVAGDPPRVIDRSLYVRAWSATVLAQRADGTLDVRADDARIGGLLAVPLRLGIPGAVATVPAGARVRVCFEGGSPAGAYAAALDQDPAATAPLALVGDSIDGGTLTARVTDPLGNVTFTYIPGVPGASPVVTSSVSIAGRVTGPGHKYLKGVIGP